MAYLLNSESMCYDAHPFRLYVRTKTGQCLRAPEVSVRMYSVMVEGNEIMIDYEDKQTQSKSEKYSK